MKCFSSTSSAPADNGSTLSSEAITDSATSTDNNYGYMGMDKNPNAHKRIVLVRLCHLCTRLHSPARSWLPVSGLLSLTGCLCVSVHQDRSLSIAAQSSVTFTT